MSSFMEIDFADSFDLSMSGISTEAKRRYGHARCFISEDDTLESSMA